MTDLSQIQEHMEVLGYDGEHVGTVDKVEDGQIKLTKNDPNAQGQHHYVSIGMVQAVDDAVRLDQPAREVMQKWQTEALAEGTRSFDL